MAKDRLHRLTSQEILNSQGPGLGWTPLLGEKLLDVSSDYILVDVTDYSRIMIGLKQQYYGYGYIQFSFTNVDLSDVGNAPLDAHHEIWMYVRNSPYTFDVPKLSGDKVYLNMKSTSDNYDISVWLVGL